MGNNQVDAEQAWGVAWTYVKTVVDTLREPFLILDERLKIISVNRTFYSFFHTNSDETVGRRIYDLGNGQWNSSKLKILLEDILPKNTFFEDFKVEHDFPKIGHRILILNARRIFMEHVQMPIMLLAMEDVTKQMQLEEQLKEYTKTLTLEVAKRTAELEARVAELERMNKVMTGRELKMVELKNKIEDLEKRLDDGNHQG